MHNDFGMGRGNRTIVREQSYHVTCRGSNREQIVWDREDCESFRAELDRVAVKFEWAVYAWCLMPNHHHITLQATQEQFSAGFQQLNGNHSRRTNRKHGRTDHLFRNRPRALEITDTAHLANAIVYVVRNPVRAKIVEHAASWPWSSYRGTVGLEPAPAWLLADDVLRLFGTESETTGAAFADAVHSGRLWCQTPRRTARQ